MANLLKVHTDMEINLFSFMYSGRCPMMFQDEHDVLKLEGELNGGVEISVVPNPDSR